MKATWKLDIKTNKYFYFIMAAYNCFGTLTDANVIAQYINYSFPQIGTDYDFADKNLRNVAGIYNTSNIASIDFSNGTNEMLLDVTDGTSTWNVDEHSLTGFSSVSTDDLSVSTINSVNVDTIFQDVEDLSHLASITSDEAAQLENIGSNIISGNNWSYLSNTDQNVSTTSDVKFNSLTTVTINGYDVDQEFEDLDERVTDIENLVADLSEDQWGYIESLDQNLSTTSDVEFSDIKCSSLSVNGDIGTTGTVDGVDINGFKTDYDLKIDQDVRTTASPSFANVTLGSKLNFPYDESKHSAIAALTTTEPNNFLTLNAINSTSSWFRSRNGGTSAFSGHAFSNYDSNNFYMRCGVDPAGTSALCTFYMDNITTQPIQPTHTPICRLGYDGTQYVDRIKETTENAGVTIETVLIKDGLVDGVDLSAFKSSYDTNINQAVKTSSTPLFESVRVNDKIYGDIYESSSTFYWQAQTLDILYVPLFRVNYTRGQSNVNIIFIVTSPSSSTVSLQLNCNRTAASYGTIIGTVSHSGDQYIHGIAVCRASGIDPTVCLVIDKSNDYTISSYKIWYTGSVSLLDETSDPRIDVLSIADTFWNSPVRIAKCLDNNTNNIVLPILPSSWGNGYYNSCNNSYFKSNLYLDRNDYLYEFKTATLTDNRTLTLPDADLDLGSIPAANTNVPSSTNTRYETIFMNANMLSHQGTDAEKKFIYSYEFWEISADSNYLTGNFKLPPGYKNGNDIEAYIQMFSSDETTVDVDLYYRWINNGDSYTGSDVQTHSLTKEFTDANMYLLPFLDSGDDAPISGSGKTNNSYFYFSVLCSSITTATAFNVFGVLFKIPINAVGFSS